MLRRRFGRTNLQMPVFSCGGMRYQHKWNDVKPEEVPKANQENLEATIRRSVELGINHIETARGYGSSEMQLGYVLPTFKRDSIIVQTKVAPMPDTKEFIATFEKSLSLLKLDYVDLFSLHGVNTLELAEMSGRPGGCLEAARSLQKAGKVRFVGFSTHGPLQAILRAVREDHYGGYDYFNLHWYYILQRNWPAIVEATARDMGVFIISPSDKGGKLYEPSPELVKLCHPLHPMVFNDLFCLSHPQVHTLSIGAARPTDFDLHLQTLPLLERAGELLPPIKQKLQQAMRESLGVEHPEQLPAGLPEHEHTPGNINIPTILWLRQLALGWGMTNFGTMRYNLLGNGGHWFPGKSATDLDQYAKAIRELLPTHLDRDSILQQLRQTHQLLGGEQAKRLSQS